MNRKENYADLDRYKKTKREQVKRHRAKYGAGAYEKREWSPLEDSMVLAHDISDAELGIKLSRSQNAIQVRRSRLRSKQRCAFRKELI